MKHYWTAEDARQTDVVWHCDALALLRALPSDYVDCIVTSPPYFGLRNYGVNGQMGLEATPQEYIANMVRLFQEARRVLKPSGNFWLNVGDSYSGNANSGGKNQNNGGPAFRINGLRTKAPDFAPKQLLMIPHRLAIALQEDGWWVRQDNVWHKPNPMPESVTDRTTRAHEYVFHLTKSERYYYDAAAVATPSKDWGPRDRSNGKYHKPGTGLHPHAGLSGDYTGFTNLRSVWTITPANYKGAHFATFPERLAEICILAGCPPGGLVLDMFMGSGTTGQVAQKHGRHYVSCDLSAEYVDISRKRLAQPYTIPMFEQVGN